MQKAKLSIRMCGLDSSSVAPSGKPFHCPFILPYCATVEPLWNPSEETIPLWSNPNFNPLYILPSMPLFLSTSLGVDYCTTAAGCLMLFSREELGRQTMLAHSRVSLHPSTLTNELQYHRPPPPPSSDHQIFTPAPYHCQVTNRNIKQPHFQW